MRRFTTAMFTVVLSLWIGCQKERSPEQTLPTVGFVINTLNNPFFIDMKKGAESVAEENGLHLIVQASERDMDVERQMQIVENFIQRKVNAICVTPNGAREIIPAIVKANKVGIPVIVVDSKVDELTLREAGGTIATFAGSDNVEGGRLAGEYIIKQLGGKGEVALLEGVSGHETGESRLKGFHLAMDNQTGISIVSSQNANWDRSQGYIVFQNILQAHPNVRAVFACNDLMALGAVEAIAAAGKTGKIIVVGFDAIEDAREAIRKRHMEATVAQFPAEMGKIAIESARKILNGEKVPQFIPVKIELITRDNVDHVSAR